jgi:hypothetical protein
MYGVIETLQITVAQLETEKAKYFHSQTNSTELPLQPDLKQIHKQHIVADENLDNLIATVQSRIEHLMKNPDLSTELQQMYLGLATTEMEKIRHCLHS